MKSLVDIVVVTYNQERFIREAIDSILMQECDFEYRIIIGEDCSSDNTRSICESYAKQHPSKIKLIINDKNLGLVRNYQSVFLNVEARYVCILEGDDYWIDPRKLQKEVDILEREAEIGLVHTNSFTLYEDGVRKKNHLSVPREMLEGDLFESLLVKKNTISPMTVCFRSEFLQYVDFNYFIQNNFRTIDYPMWLAITKQSKVKYIDEPTAVYRFLQNSVSHSDEFSKLENFYQTGILTKKYYLSKYPIDGVNEKSLLSDIYAILVEKLISQGDRRKAQQYATKLDLNKRKARLLKRATSSLIPFLTYKLYLKMLPTLSRIKQTLRS